jgi:hypothetical protein
MPAAVIDSLIVALEEHEAKTAKLKELLRDSALADVVARVLSNARSPTGDLAEGQLHTHGVQSRAREPGVRRHPPRKLRDAIRTLRPALSKRFTTFDVLKELEIMQFKPTRKGGDLKASVHAALSGMAKTGELRIAQKFAGLQPQAYEFAQNESDSAVT